MNRFFAALKTAGAVSAEAPEWFQVFPYGQVLIEDAEPAVMDDEAAQMVLAHYAGLDHDVVIDYEHQTLTGEQAPAAGWIKDLQWRGKDGLWAKVEWTELARGYIERREYRYHSPVFLARKSDRKIAEIYNIALTNQPKMMNVAALAAKHEHTNPATKEETMWKKVLKLLGLAEDVGEDQAAEALKKVIDEKTALEKKNKELETQAAAAGETVACKEVLEVLKLDDKADRETVVAAIKGMGATSDVAKELSMEVATLKKTISAMKQDDLVAEALKNGQTSPEELDKWGKKLALENPEQFKMIVLSRPKGSVIPVDGINPPPKEKGAAADEAQLEINKQMGIDDETWKKYGPKQADG